MVTVRWYHDPPEGATLVAVVHALAQLLLAIAVVAGGAAVAGTLGAVVAAVMVAVIAVVVRLLFARFAHAMFRFGRMVEARRYYRVLALVAWRRSRRAAARVSIAASYVGAGDYPRGLALLAAIDPARLDPSTRAGWLNNRAYATLRSGAVGAEAETALADIRAALAIHADVGALLHTEALALYACGHTEDAIAHYEAMWQRGELAPRLDAERCDDLAVAWAARGETAYADDYRRRARAAVPTAPWRPDLTGGDA